MPPPLCPQTITPRNCVEISIASENYLRNIPLFPGIVEKGAKKNQCHKKGDFYLTSWKMGEDGLLVAVM